MFKCIYHLFFGKQFTFYSPYHLDEALDRLLARSERDSRKPSIWQRRRSLLMITIETDGWQSYRFHADRDFGKNLLIVSTGSITQDESGVNVRGIVRLGRFTLIFPFIWLGLWWGLWGGLFANHPTVNVMVLYGLVIVMLLFAVTMYGQYKIYKLIHDTLGKTKKKRH